MDLRRVLYPIAACALLAAVSCGDDAFGPDTNFVGRWLGAGSQGGTQFRLDMTITAVNDTGAVTGTGTVSGTIGVPVNINGTFRGGRANLSINAIGFFAAFFTGTAADRNTISGSVSGSGFTGMPLTLRRQ